MGCICGSNPVLLWLWCRPAAAALIRSLAWELPYATGAAPKKTNRQKTKKKKKKPKLPHDLVTLLLSIHPKEMKSVSQRNIRIPLFTEALITTAKIWEQPKYLFKDE